MGSAYRQDIDGLRAVAVVPVVLYHSGVVWIPGGYVGVDVFFVISGYLITGILARELADGSFSLASFYERRARRILPALSVVVLATMIAGWVLLFPRQFEDLSRSALATVFFGSNFYFFSNTNYFSISAEFRPLLHMWSLAVEEQFYVLFPVLLFALARWAPRQLVRVILLIFLVSFGLSAWAAYATPMAAFFLAPSRAWQLMLGALLALNTVPAWKNKLALETASATGLTAIIASVFLYSEDTRFPGIAAALPSLGAALIIQAGRAPGATTFVGRVLSTRGVVFIGLISYSLYLWHWPILAYLRVYYQALHVPVFAATLGVAAALLISTLSWKYVERPFRRKEIFSRRQIVAYSMTAMALLVSLGATVSIFRGVPDRFSPSVLDVFSEARDSDDYRRACMGLPRESEYCVLGDEKMEPSILVWGDSHAASVSPAVAKVAEALNRSLYVASFANCAPLRDVGATGRYDSNACFSANNETLEFVKSKSDQLDAVILAARWPFYVTGERAEGELGYGIKMVALGQETEQTNAEAVEYGLSRKVEELTDLGVNVVLLGAVPEIGWHVPTWIARQLHSGRKLPKAPDLADFRRRNRESDEILQRIANGRNVTFVEVGPILCDPVCLVQENDKLVYSDDDHLTVYAASEILGTKLISPLGETLR